MKRVFSVVFFVLAELASVHAEGSRAWAHDESDLSADPNVVWGSLENGFRYALLPRDNKPGVVSMRLLVEVGSLNEQPKEQGLAHFVEHMAFRGTRHFETGELIAFFQRLGMSYGVDVNAFTYPNKTVYHLELPQNEASLLSQAFQLYRDYADGILFNENLLDTEREIVLREKETHEMPSMVAARTSSNFAFEGTLLAQRDPIGLEQVIKGVSRKQLVAFYQKWYRPELMTLVVVGDIKPELLKLEIAKEFGSMVNPRQKTPAYKMGKLGKAKSFRSGYMSIEGVDRRTLRVFRSWMEPGKSDSLLIRKTDTRRSFATALLNERARRVTDGMSSDYAYYERVFGMPHCQFSISAPGDNWEGAYLWMDRMIRQAIDYGFNEDEIAFLKENWIQLNRSSALRYESAEPRDLIDDLVDHISMDRVYLSSAMHDEIFKETIESLTRESLGQEFSDIWQLKSLAYFMVGEFERGPSRSAIKRTLKDDRKFNMLPYVDEIHGDFEYTDLGESGKLIEQGEIAEVGASTYRFENNVRLTFLHTENEKNMVRALVRVGGGMLEFEDSNPATHALAMTSLFRSAFGDNEIEDVYSELRNNVLSFVYGLEDHDAFTYRAVTQSEGLDEFLGIVSEYLIDPTVDEDAFEMAQTKLRQSREFDGDGLNEGYRNLIRMIYPGEARFHSPSLKDINSVDTEVLSDWMETPFREGYLEIAIVGDVEESKAVEIVASTLGALPERRANKLDLSEVRSLKINPLTGKHRVEYQEGKGENAASVVVWTIQENISFEERVSLYVLSAVLENRIRERVREEMGASYSPSVNYVSFPAYDTLRHVRVDVDCSSAEAEDLLDVILEIVSNLTKETIEAKELEAAVAPLEESIRLAWSDNAYLLENVLHGVQEYPSVVENALRYKNGAFSSVTVEGLRNVAKQYLVAEEALAVAIVPEMSGKLTGAGVLKASKRKKAGSTRR